MQEHCKLDGEALIPAPVVSDKLGVGGHLGLEAGSSDHSLVDPVRK